MLFLEAFAEEFSNHGTLNTGVISTLDTINRRVAKIAVDVALQEQDANSNPSILNGRRLNLFVHSKYSGFLKIFGNKY